MSSHPSPIRDPLVNNPGSWILWTLAATAVLLAVCFVVSLFFTVTFGPLLWLLSRAAGKGRDPKQSDERKGEIESFELWR